MKKYWVVYRVVLEPGAPSVLLGNLIEAASESRAQDEYCIRFRRKYRGTGATIRHHVSTEPQHTIALGRRLRLARTEE